MQELTRHQHDKTKVYDPNLKVFALEAELQTSKLITAIGCQCINQPDGQYGVDHLVQYDGMSYTADTERSRIWQHGGWHPNWKLTRIPGRKAGFINSGLRLYFMWRKDLACVRIIDVKTARESDAIHQVKVNTRQRPDGEWFWAFEDCYCYTYPYPDEQKTGLFGSQQTSVKIHEGTQ